MEGRVVGTRRGGGVGGGAEEEEMGGGRVVLGRGMHGVRGQKRGEGWALWGGVLGAGCGGERMPDVPAWCRQARCPYR